MNDKTRVPEDELRANAHEMETHYTIPTTLSMECLIGSQVLTPDDNANGNRTFFVLNLVTPSGLRIETTIETDEDYENIKESTATIINYPGNYQSCFCLDGCIGRAIFFIDKYCTMSAFRLETPSNAAKTFEKALIDKSRDMTATQICSRGNKAAFLTDYGRVFTYSPGNISYALGHCEPALCIESIPRIKKIWLTQYELLCLSLEGNLHSVGVLLSKHKHNYERLGQLSRLGRGTLEREFNAGSLSKDLGRRCDTLEKACLLLEKQYKRASELYHELSESRILFRSDGTHGAITDFFPVDEDIGVFILSYADRTSHLVNISKRTSRTSSNSVPLGTLCVGSSAIVQIAGGAKHCVLDVTGKVWMLEIHCATGFYNNAFEVPAKRLFPYHPLRFDSPICAISFVAIPRKYGEGFFFFCDVEGTIYRLPSLSGEELGKACTNAIATRIASVPLPMNRTKRALNEIINSSSDSENEGEEPSPKRSKNE